MKIYIKSFPLFMRIGHFAKEKKANRMVSIDLEMTLAKTTLHTIEQLECTVDYAHVMQTLEQEFSDKSINLLESLAFMIAQVLIKKFPLLEKISVRVEKSLMSAKLVKGAKILVESEFSRKDFL